MKKKYIIPTTEVVMAETTRFMVPNSQINPGVGANSSLFDEEEEEEQWDKLDNSMSHAWE